MATLKNVTKFINEFLEIDKFKDYAPNGLQVEGKEKILKIVTGVSATHALIEAADTVTEMRDIKHAYRAGIMAQKGVEL